MCREITGDGRQKQSEVGWWEDASVQDLGDIGMRIQPC